MATKKKSPKSGSSKPAVNFSVTFSPKTVVEVNDIADSDFRNNRSMAIESMVKESPTYKRHSKKRSRKK